MRGRFEPGTPGRIGPEQVAELTGIRIMDRIAVFVDAGYLFAQGSVLVAGRTLPRHQIVLDHNAVITALTDLAKRVSGSPLLRVYWYDGTSTGPIPRDLDGKLLARGRAALGGDLDSAQKQHLRHTFLAACNRRVSTLR
jgi:hypothetical protein